MNKTQERFHNTLSLFKTLRLERSLTQAELKERLHLQASTISYLVNDLKKQNLIKNSEKCVQTIKVGKPGQYLEIDNHIAYFLGLYLEETFIDLHVIGLADEEIHYQRIALEDYAPNDLINRIIEIINVSIGTYHHIKGVGVAVKSVVDSQGNLSSFKRTMLDKEVPKIWKVEGFTSTIRNAFPHIPIVVENDANCAAVYCKYAGKHLSCSAMIFIINEKPFGVGCGVIIDGKLYRGFNGASGELYFSDRRIQDVVEENSTHKDPITLINMLHTSILKAIYLLDPEQVFLTGGLFADMPFDTVSHIEQLFTDVPYKVTILTQKHVSLSARGAVLLVADEYIEDLFVRYTTEVGVKKASIKYFAGRAFKVIFTVWVVTTLIFFLIRLMPSNPIEQYVQNLVVQYGMSYEEANSRAESLFSINLDKTIVSQYVDYLKAVARLDFGTSFLSPGVKVSTIIASRLPWTLFTVGMGLILSFLMGITLGAISAYKRDSFYEPIISGVSSFLSAIPDFLIAIFIILFFGVFTFGGTQSIIPIFQMRGNYDAGVVAGFNVPFIKSVFIHAFGPILTYFFSQIGIWVLLMKGSTTGCLHADYAIIARARGLRPKKILFSYIGRNAMLPIATEFAMRLGFIIGGSLIIEQLFVYQGIGLELLKATTNRDYPLMQGIFLIMTIAIVLANLLAEVVYSILDPRIRVKGENIHA